jgi:eukaryotic-like serine/threonine-protein kinase
MGPRENAGAVIGRYHLLQKIGEGGMGEVWLAEQKEPVRRRVALKLVKAGMNSREVIARFESERQALALMDHPAIAKVFDAGSTPQGAPYFVMEYVAGVPINAYCDNYRLSTRERLELFMHVCEGVQHAHQKAIIHRDLKPSNILVTEIDGQAAPKIIDFGVAKALTQKLTADTIFTRVGALVGTPQYMSPEQADSSGEDIDTRTDVYSLGVILYELLAGAPPIELKKIAFDEYLRRLRDEEPPKPSTKIRTQDEATSTAMANKRQTEPQVLIKQIRGDLDSIALKALEKDRSRRYGSPSDFAADVRRYLNNEAVLAVPPSAAYRARKFARRYRVALATICAFVLVLVAAAAISIRQSLRANREAAAAEAVNEFLQNDLLAQASANTQSGGAAKPDPDLKVRTALDRAAARIAGKFDRQPQVEAAIRDTIGQTYIELGQYPQAREQLERAVDLYRRVLGAENPKTLIAMRRLGYAALLQGKYAEAEKLLSQALLAQRRVLGPEHPETLRSTINLAGTYIRQGKPAQGEVLYSRLVEIQRRVMGPEHPDTLRAMNNLSIAYLEQGKYGQAEVLYSQTLEIKRRVFGPEHPVTLTSMMGLADVYGEQGKYGQAEALFTQALEIHRRVLGPEHPETLRVMYDLAEAYSQQGKYTQAEPLYNQTLEIRRRVLGPYHPDLLATYSDMAVMYQRQGKYDAAESYAAQSLAGRRRTIGPEHPDTMDAAADLAQAYQSQGKFAESEPLARESLEFDRKKRPDNWQRFRAESLLGASLAGQKKYAEAEPLLLAGYKGMTARKDRMGVADQYYLDRAREWIVQLYEAWGKPEKTAEWRRTSTAGQR